MTDILPVDISEVAVDNAASYLDETDYPQSAAMLRALRTALTEAQTAYFASLAALEGEYQKTLQLNRNAAKVIEDQTRALTAAEKQLKAVRVLNHANLQRDHFTCCDKTMGDSHACTCGMSAYRTLLQQLNEERS